MAIAKSQTINELLFRWDDKGSLKGAHVVFRESVSDAGVEIYSRFTNPQSVAVAGSAGVNLADLIPAITMSALTRADLLSAQVDVLTADKAAAESDRDAAHAQIAELQTKIAALQPPADVNGIPQVISKKQGRAQLKAEQLLTPVELYIINLPVDNDSRMAYEDAATWVRTDPNVIDMLGLLGKTAADADAFFLAAAGR